MNTCENCKYSEPVVGALACMGQKGMPYVRPCDSCNEWKSKHITNYDSIISKTPEELALWLSDIAEWLPHYAGKAHAILKWLEQEVTE